MTNPQDLPAPGTHVTVDDVAAQVRSWTGRAERIPVPGSAQMLADVLRDPNGLRFTVSFVDRVIRPEDPAAAAIELRRLAENPPSFLSPALRALVTTGAQVSRLAPQLVVPLAQRMMREMVSHLVLDARPHRLGREIARLRRGGVGLNINLLGEAVLGAREAHRRLDGIRELIRREDVDYVSIKVSAIVDHISLWGADETVEHILHTLIPVYLEAAAHGTFLNLDMEEYKDLEITTRVFEHLMELEEIADQRLGIVLQAYLPDAAVIMPRLREKAQARRARGGAPIKVRLVKGANLAMERVDASVHGWPLATVSSKQAADAQYKRVLLDSLTAENLDAVHLGIAGHNLFDVAFAHLLRRERGLEGHEGVEFEMLAGMAPGQQQVVREDVGSMRLYVPIVAPEHFDVAVSYLVRRLEENASEENFMSAVFELESEPRLFDRERERFAASLRDALEEPAPPIARNQDRSAEGEMPELGSVTLPAVPRAFRSTPDTDMSTPANQAWARGVLSRIDGSRLGVASMEAAAVSTLGEVDARIQTAIRGHETWSARPVSERADLLRRGARLLAGHRAELLEVAASETGKMLEQGDPEVSEAIDFALFYADQAQELAEDEELRLLPQRVTLVTPPWNFPLAIPTGSMLAPLVTGSAVIVKPAPQSRRCAAVIVDLLHEAGIPQDALQLVDVPENEVGRALISDPRIDQVILTGAYETAALFASWRPELDIHAETSGKNAIVVTPSADLDLAARDVALSAFGHAGQKCSAASLVITVGSVERSTRFRAQLADAVLSLRTALPTDPTAQVGPVIEAPTGKLARGLEHLGEGERWLNQPRSLSDDGRLVTPGVRDDVQPGSEFHMTEYFGPILGIMHAETLAEAVTWQNATDYGLTAGLQSLDEDEIAWWTQNVHAGNLYINRGITGAIVERQPFGGWKRSAIGQTAKAGGPHHLIHLMRATDAPSISDAATSPDAWLRLAQASDEHHMATTFAPRDAQDLHGERNIMRYEPMVSTIRAAEDAEPAHLARVLHAARSAGAAVEVSLADEDLSALPELKGLSVHVEDARAFAERVGDLPANMRVRLVGGADTLLLRAISRRPEIGLWKRPVVASGRIELLAFLREQAISATDHRFGTPLPQELDLTGGVPVQRGR